MRLVFLFGLPGSGKLSVAKALSALTGWKLFHNHLTVDLLLAVFPFGSKEFIEFREQIWLSVFAAAAASEVPSLIFTFNPENTVRQSFIEQTLNLISKHSARVEFVEMLCEEFAIIGERKHLLVGAAFWRIQAILKRRFAIARCL